MEWFVNVVGLSMGWVVNRRGGLSMRCVIGGWVDSGVGWLKIFKGRLDHYIGTRQWIKIN